jgi:hypothetical protein
MNTSNRFNIETIARQHQAEIEKELATRHLLKESKLNTFGLTKSRRMVLRYTSVIIILSWLLVHFLR